MNALLGPEREMATPFAQDAELCEIAQFFGLAVQRREQIEITDEAAIKQAGLMKQSPDYSRIRKAMQDGEVPGARWKGVEYVLRRNQL